MVLDRLKSQPAPLDGPVTQSFKGAALFADMAGFTRLTDTIMKLYPEDGLWRLGKIVETYLSHQIDLLIESGGDILKFAGDAIFAVWYAKDEDDMGYQVHRAIRTALKIQKELHNYDIGDGLKFSLRIGIGAGSIHALHVGGVFDRYELIIAGDAVAEATESEKKAVPGQVAVSPLARRLVSGVSGGYSTGNKTYQLVNIERTAEPKPYHFPGLEDQAELALRSYIPRSIITLLEKGPETNTLQILTVSVMFVHILGLNSHVAPVGRINEYMKKVQSCLYRYEGSINRFGMESAGAIILAAFGLPPLMHDDDGFRAIRAAVDIRKEIAELGSEAQIGIATGVVFCGPMGNKHRSEYTMHGNVVNLASRMMSNSKSILCEEVTYERTKDKIPFIKHEPIPVKGHENPVPIFSVKEDEVMDRD